MDLLKQTQSENPEARFIPFHYDSNLNVDSQYWVTMARKIGWENSSVDADFILFLDADEIVDAHRFINWLKKFPLQKFNILKLANYYYFREPNFQADIFEDSAILVKRNLLTAEMIMDFEDRNKPFSAISNPKQRMVLGVDHQPMIHHYSWVRTKEEMLRKVRTWGHNKEQNWEAMVEKEFAHAFSGTDFVHGYQYKIVESFI